MSRVIVKNLPKNTTEAQIRDFFSIKGEVTDIKQLKDQDGAFKKVAFIGFREVGNEESLVKFFNNNYMGTSRITVEAAKSTLDKTLKRWSKTTSKASYPEKSLPEDLDSTRLYLRNLTYTVSKEDIELLFSPFGELEEVTVPFDHSEHRGKGFAYVKFKTTESAVQAFEKLDRSVFQGRLLHIIPSQKKPEVELKLKEKSSYKLELAKELQKRAKNSTTWNTLFINQDTVNAVMSEKMHISKGDFLDKDLDDLPVRVSLAETKIINEIKDWMTLNDINFEAFQGERNSTKRSDVVIIVKNLAKGTILNEVKEIFARFGNVVRCLMPPSKTIALIEFQDPSQAQVAFEKLAYFTYRLLPLYLEWAPLNTFDSPAGEFETITKANSTTLFVKNLNFATTQEALEEHFKQSGQVKSAKIIKNQGMPCGYGFVEFESEKSASKALRNLNNSVLDGHSLKLSESKTSVQVAKKRQRNEEVEEDKEQDDRTKITVKNLAFEATAEELRNIFKNFGDVKNVRIPSKASGGHRGFGFVEFVSHEEAKIAMEALQNSHFYGRRMVIEWSKEESSLSALKSKS
jgi:multiple RNA-binding domain-containing protein 1